MGKIEFPRWIYKGKSEKKIVESLEAYQAALADGWRKGVIDEAGIDDSEKLEKISDDVRFIRKEVRQISKGVDALQSGKESPSMSEAEAEPEAETEPATMSYRQMLEEKAKKLNIKFGIKTSNSQLAAMIQRRG
jgi:outer membrane murein-binding lipoprotein Lpp